MQYIPGEDIATLMIQRGGAFSLSEVMDWADQLLKVLSYLHSQQPTVIHRDIKPENLKLTTTGEIILLDFGLAKNSALIRTSMTTNRSVIGYTLAYAPLEQIQDIITDPRSDLYAFAATLYHLLTGTPPANALERAVAIASHQHDPLQPVHALNPQVPTAVSDVLLQGLALQIGDRLANAEEMRIKLIMAMESPKPKNKRQQGTKAVVQSNPAFLQSRPSPSFAPNTGPTKIVPQPSTTSTPAVGYTSVEEGNIATNANASTSMTPLQAIPSSTQSSYKMPISPNKKSASIKENVAYLLYGAGKLTRLVSFCLWSIWSLFVVTAYWDMSEGSVIYRIIAVDIMSYLLFFIPTLVSMVFTLLAQKLGKNINPYRLKSKSNKVIFFATLIMPIIGLLIT